MTAMQARRRDPIWLYAVIGMVIIGLYLWSSMEERPDSRPRGSIADLSSLAERDDLNVLFILVDTLRADRMSVYGYERDTTPNLKKLADTGIRFDLHISQSSWTKTSMAALWTGVYPARNGVHDHSHGVADQARMPAEIFSDHGFETAGIWRNGWVAPTFGFSQGFKTYLRPPPTSRGQQVQREGSHPARGVLAGSDDSLMYSAIEFLKTNQNKKWFLYLHFMDLHQYVSDSEAARFGTDYSDMYDNATRREDRLIGALLGLLDELGLSERTLVVVGSDHGEAFREHGNEGHAKDLYSEVTHVPFILGLPFSLEEAVVVETATANVDIWPTVLDLMGYELQPGLDGISQRESILRAAREESAPDSGRAIFSELDRTWGRVEDPPEPLVSVTQNGRRFMNYLDEPRRNRLFDLRSDPAERHDLKEQEPEIAAELQEMTRQHREESEPMWKADVPTVELSEMELNHLRALGYDLR